MAEVELTEVVDLIYAAALDEGATWLDLGVRLREVMDAQRATFWLPDEAGKLSNKLMPVDVYEELYASQYSQLDPYRAASLDVSVDECAQGRGGVWFGHEIVPEARYLQTEFYASFARRSSCRYMIGALVSAPDVTPLGFHRDAAAQPFAEADRRTISLLLPHLQRALQMRARLAPATPGLGAGALDALAIAVIIVDSRMQVLYSNAEGAALLGDPKSGLAIERHGPGLPVVKPRLFARNPDDDALLCRLVGAAARGGAGGGMQIRPRLGGLPGDPATLSAIVGPALRHRPPSALTNVGASVMPGAATVLARNLLRPTSPPVRLLIDLFGLTQSEGEVAAALAGGVTAEDVARGRRVSLDTVRSQIRTILGKTGASGLRDFERIIALSSTMHVPDARSPQAGTGVQRMPSGS